MDCGELFNIADAVVFAKTGKHLRDIEKIIFKGACENQTYQKIANNNDYELSTIKTDAKKLWDKLSDALGEEVSKSNFETALELRGNVVTTTSKPHPLLNTVPDLELPNGQVPLNSAFFIERPPIESECYNEILRPGALLRIKAPRQMGKTSLTSRILDYAGNQGYEKVRLNLETNKDVFTSLDKFLRWFCASVSYQLELQPLLDNYWNEEMFGSNQSCTMYFYTHLLKQLNNPIALVLDGVDAVFPHNEIAQGFFPLIREWHEEAKNIDIWQRLRVVVVYSTEVYIPLSIHQSPFNVGLPVELPEFNLDQVQELAQRHQLSLKNSQIQQLMTIVGGHPYLIRLTFYSMKHQNITLESILENAYTESGIYAEHLRHYLATFWENLELRNAFKKVVTIKAPVQLESMQIHQLQRMGLVQVKGNDVMPRCNLYRQYFRERV